MRAKPQRVKMDASPGWNNIFVGNGTSHAKYFAETMEGGQHGSCLGNHGSAMCRIVALVDHISVGLMLLQRAVATIGPTSPLTILRCGH